MFEISKENKEFLKKVYILAMPMIIQGLLDSSVQIVDTIMIGSLGTETIAGVGIANQIFFIFILLVVGIASGCNIFVGQYFGSGNYKNIKKIIGIALVSSITIGVVFSAMALTIPDKLLSLYSKDQNVIDIGIRYITIVAFTYILVSISFILHSAIKSIQQPKYSTLTTAITLGTNTFLNYLFIFVFDMGVEGAAIATLIARTIEIITLITIMYKKQLIIAGSFKEYFTFDKELVKLYYSRAMYAILNEVVWATGVSTYTMSYGIVGTNAQAAVQITNSTSNLFMVTSMAIGSSCCIMLADLLGAKENEKAVDYSKKFIITGLTFASFMSISFVILTPLIVKIFKAEPSVADDVLKIAYIQAVVNLAKTYNFIGVIGILRSGGDTKFTLILDFIFVWCVGVPLAYVAAKTGLPVYIVVLGAGMEEVLKVPVLYLRVKHNKWANTLV